MKFDADNNRFIYEKNGKTAGELTIAGPDNKNQIEIIQTMVDPDFRGLGIAGELMDEVIKFADEHNYKIIPICSYAKKTFQKKPELRYILTEKYQKLYDGADNNE